MPSSIASTSVFLLRHGVPVALIAGTAALIGFDELRLAVLGPPVVEIRGAPLAAPWVPDHGEGRVLLPIASPGDPRRIIAMVSAEGFEEARELLSADRNARVQGHARQPSREEIGLISRAAGKAGLDVHAGLAILETGRSRAAMPAALLLFAAGALVLISVAAALVRPLALRRKATRKTMPSRTNPPPTPAEPEGEPEAPVVALDPRPDTVANAEPEVLETSEAEISELATLLARAAMDAMAAREEPLGDEARQDIRNAMQEIWDRA
jgi:hypothetical protein